MNRPQELREKLISFTINILYLTKKLPKTESNRIFSNQIIRSSSSIGANYSEAMFAHSKLEFIHCVNISRKEVSETIYWLEIIKRTNPNLSKDLELLIAEAESYLKIFVSSIKTAKNNLKKNEK